MISGVTARRRRTLRTSTVRLEGIGLHTGAAASVRVLPAEAYTGIVFYAGGQEIPACVENVSDTGRCTQLQHSGVTIQTVEHLMSALAGLSIDDARIEIEGPELPAVDGSALPYVALLQTADVIDQPQEAQLEPWLLTEARLVTGDGGATLLALPSNRFQVTAVVDYPKYPFLGTQSVTFDSASDTYESAVAPARTYGFLSELDWLHAHGLGLGASYENCVVLREDGYDVPLRFPNELVRHKLLDVIGDLRLVDRPVIAHFIAIKPSHSLNVSMATLLARDVNIATHRC